MATAGWDDRRVRTVRRAPGRVVPDGAEVRRPLRVRGKATPDADIVEARFMEFVPTERVVQEVDFVSDDPAYAGMTMTWAVTPVDGGARVDIIADNVPDGISPRDHAEGMASSLAKLANYLQDKRTADLLPPRTSPLDHGTAQPLRGDRARGRLKAP